MADQDELRAMVRRMVERGDDEKDIALVIQKHRPTTNTFDADVARGASKATGIGNTDGPLVAPGGGRGTRLNVGRSDQWARNNAPAIGATLAATATGGTYLPIAAAFAGGYGGSRLRGDDNETALWQGAEQAAWQGAPKIVEGLSRTTYNAGIPKSVLDKFRGVDIAGQGMSHGAVLGTTQGVNRAAAAQAGARRATTAAAPGVRPLSATDIQAGFQPAFREAVQGRAFDDANLMSGYVNNAMQEVGSQPLSGAQQLARKNSLHHTRNPNTSSLNPELANRERSIITQNLRSDPAMKAGLDAAQASKGLRQAALATEHSTPITRLKTNGVWDAMHMPSVTSALGIAGYGTSKALNPNVTRLLMSLMSQRSNDEP